MKDDLKKETEFIYFVKFCNLLLHASFCLFFFIYFYSFLFTTPSLLLLLLFSLPFSLLLLPPFALLTGTHTIFINAHIIAMAQTRWTLVYVDIQVTDKRRSHLLRTEVDTMGVGVGGRVGWEEGTKI
jgi:hypothetical protein